MPCCFSPRTKPPTSPALSSMSAAAPSRRDAHPPSPAGWAPPSPAVREASSRPRPVIRAIWASSSVICPTCRPSCAPSLVPRTRSSAGGSSLKRPKSIRRVPSSASSRGSSTRSPGVWVRGIRVRTGLFPGGRSDSNHRSCRKGTAVLTPDLGFRATGADRRNPREGPTVRIHLPPAVSLFSPVPSVARGQEAGSRRECGPWPRPENGTYGPTSRLALAPFL